MTPARRPTETVLSRMDEALDQMAAAIATLKTSVTDLKDQNRSLHDDEEEEEESNAAE